ncbi:MAG: TIGR02221 family CRISPR-associated protein, partial [Campylobacterota bacterium]|nr:TIGR02221 family CRISPR-associated protein [Campylobacterota bacterium]
AKYKLNNQIYTTSFVADALMQELKIDKLFLVGTKKSIWDEAYNVFVSKENENISYYEDLYTKKEAGKIASKDLEKFDELLPKGSKSFIIDYGINEDELWFNFEKFLAIAEYIEDGDELYLDITHSFRSLSLMSFVMTQFASSISDKKFKISGIYYGMFEYSFESEDNTTPIVDIKILLEIQEWIKAIDAIKNYSDFNHLIRLLNENDIEKDVQNTFINLNNNISLANIASLRQFIQTASKKIKTINSSENRIVKLLAPEILKLVEELEQNRESDFQYTLAQWFYKNKNHALSYIALYEAIITKSCELSNADIHNHSQREDAKKSIGNDKYGKYFYTKYDDSISQIRNSIVHQSSDRKSKVSNDIKKLEIFIETFEEYFNIGKQNA